MLWRLTLSVTFCCQLKTAHGLGINVEKIGLWRVINTDFDGPILVGCIPWFIVICPFRNVDLIEAAIVDIGLHLIRIRGAAAFLLARLAAEPNQRPYAGATLVIDDVICIVFVFCRAVVIDKALKPHTRAQVDQN